MSQVASRITYHVSRFTFHILRHRLAALIATLVASEAIYLYAFARRYALLRYWNEPLLDLGKIAQRDFVWAAEFVAAFVALFALYALAIRLCHSERSKEPHPRVTKALGRFAAQGDRLWLVVIVGTLVFGVTLLLVYPVGAGDIFDYVVHGVLLARYHVSPLVQVGTSFPQEPLVAFSAWRHYPSYYGPLWSWLEAGVDLFAGPRDLLANLLMFKSVALAGVLCSAWLIAQIVARRAPDRALQSVVFLAWNPLVLFEATTNGHNDVIMLAFVLAAFLAWERGRWTWAVVAMTLSVLVKAPPLPLLGLLSVAVVAQAPGWQVKLQRAAISAGFVAALMGVAYLTFPQSLASALNLRGRAELFTNSLPAVAMRSLQLAMPQAAAESLARTGTLLAFALFGTWKAWQTWKEPARLLRSSFETLAFLLLLATPWFQPWYALWLVVLAAIYPRESKGADAAQKLAGLFSLTVTWSYVVYGFAWFWFIPQMNWGNTLGAQATGFLVTYALPLAYLARRACRVRALTGKTGRSSR